MPGRKAARARWRVRRPALWISAAIVAVLGVAAVLGPWIRPHDPLAIDFPPLSPPSFTNPFGTDDLGRDVFSRFVVGTQISVIVGVLSVGIAAALGILTGLIAAYAPRFRAVLMRTMDAIWSFPMIMLALGLAASLEPGQGTVVLAIAIVYSPLFARVVYGQALAILERDFITAARAFGCGPGRLLGVHVLPNVAGAILVQATLSVGTAIVLESSLSFLGVGIQPPTPSWGLLMQAGYRWLEQAPWISVLPGIGLYSTVVAFSVLGDWLRISLDPRQVTLRV
ncbi:MAG TPA: ABC transporter permease [Candidatus Sulfotelmatobacter sp.]|nr:ABC transporter permease [Candidatus Sulfotelmatobacter sp.]